MSAEEKQKLVTDIAATPDKALSSSSLEPNLDLSLTPNTRKMENEAV